MFAALVESHSLTFVGVHLLCAELSLHSTAWRKRIMKDQNQKAGGDAVGLWATEASQYKWIDEVHHLLFLHQIYSGQTLLIHG